MKSKISLILLTIIILSSCTDENNFSELSFEFIATEWFDKNTDSYIWENKKARINWSKTSLVTDTNDKQYLVIPFKEYKTFENSDYIFSRNIILSYGDGKIVDGKIIDVLSKSKEYLLANENQILMGILQQDLSEFQTYVFVYDLNFNQKSLESNSENKAKSQLTIKKEIDNSTNNGRTADYMCIHYYYGSNSSGWEYLGSTCYSLHVLGDGGGGGGANDPIWEDYPGGSGSPPDESSVDYEALIREWEITKIIYANLKPCMKSILNDVQNLNQGSVGQIIQKFSGSIPGYNWELKDGSLVGGQNAFTSQAYNKTTGMVTSTFDGSKFTGSTDLSIARTILHESAHAYLIAHFRVDYLSARSSYPDLVNDYAQQNYGGDANQIQHAEFVRNFVNEIAIALEQYGRNKGYGHTSQFYQDLAWGGLTHTGTYDASGNPIETTWFQSSVSSATDRKRIVDTVTIEQTGKDFSGLTKTQKGTNAGC